jgi:hypothetical protein
MLFALFTMVSDMVLRRITQEVSDMLKKAMLFFE